jgi:hypothetical protein
MLPDCSAELGRQHELLAVVVALANALAIAVVVLSRRKNGNHN